jgi:hypothetical protein
LPHRRAQIGAQQMHPLVERLAVVAKVA